MSLTSQMCLFFILQSKKQTVQMNLHHFICLSAECINKLLLYDIHLHHLSGGLAHFSTFRSVPELFV